MKILQNLPQTLLRWAKSSEDGRGGKTYSSAVEVSCLWFEKRELFPTESGKEKLSRAIVYVESDVVVGDMIALGDLDDAGSDLTDPYDASVEAYMVERFEKTPTLKGTDHLRKVFI